MMSSVPTQKNPWEHNTMQQRNNDSNGWNETILFKICSLIIHRVLLNVDNLWTRKLTFHSNCSNLTPVHHFDLKSFISSQVTSCCSLIFTFLFLGGVSRRQEVSKRLWYLIINLIEVLRLVFFVCTNKLNFVVVEHLWYLINKPVKKSVCCDHWGVRTTKDWLEFICSIMQWNSMIRLASSCHLSISSLFSILGRV